MKYKIYIRTDGNSQIGLGHFVRCMALGQMLKAEFSIHFISKEIPKSIEYEMEQSGFAFTLIDSEDDFLNLLSGNEMVVLDHYGLGSDDQLKIKERGSKLVCIDDLHHNPFYADLIINHSPGISPKDYNARPYTQYALGPAFALLRPAFLTAERTVKEINSIATVLICFGGADPKNLTLTVLALVKTYPAFKKIVVITGAAYAGLSKLEGLLSPENNIAHFHAVDEHKMAEFMANTDLCIVPSSGILLEALAASSLVISGMYIENQRNLFENYKKLNAFISAEDFSTKNLTDAINKSLEGTDKAKPVIDGKSNERILKIFRQLACEDNLNLRKVEPSDLTITYQWATDKLIRSFSFNQGAIDLETHSNWFSSKINDPHCFFLIAAWNKALIGTIRFDIKDENAVISYLIDKEYHHQGFGIMLLRKGIIALMNEKKANIKRITGFVMIQNIASCKTFEKLGFIKEKENDTYTYRFTITSLCK